MIDLSHLKGRRYGVFGLGRTGMAAVKALVAGGAEVLAWDDTASQRQAAEDAGAELADFATAPLNYLEAIVWSPGAPFLAPKPLPAAMAARRAGVPLISDIQLLLDAAPEVTFVGITGSNGKSTTTALIAHILDVAGCANAVGGNLGPPTLGLETLGAGGVYVLELSSYQLELTPSPRFNIALLLNLEPDHLERHGGLHTYGAIKRTIFNGQPEGSMAIVGVDDAHGRWLEARLANATPVSAGTETPARVYADETTLFDDGTPVFTFKDARALGGAHNRQNAAAAYAACRALGIATADIASGLTSFPGLPHRQELAATLGQVRYVNDSKATNASAAARALASFDRIYWIAGGLAKDGGVSGIEPWLNRIQKAYLIGEAAPAFARQLALMAPSMPVAQSGDVLSALNAAHRDAQADPATSVVLLSPACASFDQFPSYEARGDAFRVAAQRLSQPQPRGAAA
ncbi:MAG: UDP-N-acetylmuramoyl-L-alanine--D-glutamate ligase [Alphaproteobacteria bacterium]|jgi:UDP-N-acetylmuramoylalanine--D-glutamate ligase|nr:UDP-N-acetylmuramoyl-L-alanine--D-glutamate ligase [Alphaproteobacteria bacterium]